MSLIEINFRPDKKQLRSFGFIALIACGLIFAFLLLYKKVSFSLSAVPLFIGIIIFLSSLFSYRLTRLFYLGLMFLGLPFGLAVSFLLMTAFYLLIITPMALLFRIIGRDALHRSFDKNKKTYWIAHKQCDSYERYFRQF
jgi:hypothetical protein